MHVTNFGQSLGALNILVCAHCNITTWPWPWLSLQGFCIYHLIYTLTVSSSPILFHEMEGTIWLPFLCHLTTISSLHSRQGASLIFGAGSHWCGLLSQFTNWNVLLSVINKYPFPILCHIDMKSDILFATQGDYVMIIDEYIMRRKMSYSSLA